MLTLNPSPATAVPTWPGRLSTMAGTGMPSTVTIDERGWSSGSNPFDSGTGATDGVDAGAVVVVVVVVVVGSEVVVVVVVVGGEAFDVPVTGRDPVG